jgi:hypothetical protein
MNQALYAHMNNKRKMKKKKKNEQNGNGEKPLQPLSTGWYLSKPSGEGDTGGNCHCYLIDGGSGLVGGM